MDLDTDNIDFSTFDFSKLECVFHNEGEYRPIEEIVPDYGIRMTKYPDVTHLKEEVFRYKLSDKKTLTRKIRTGKRKVLKRVLERRQNWKKFGQAAISNDGVTTIGAPVYMQLANPDGTFTQDEDSSGIIRNVKNALNKKKSGFQLAYKPKMDLIEKANDKMPAFNSTKKSGGYIPASIRSKLAENQGLENFSVVIKNIPTSGLDVNSLRNTLRSLFEKFGHIEKVKVLTDRKTGLIKDIAFIDFVYPADAQKLLDSKERFIIGACILSKEKAKSRK